MEDVIKQRREAWLTNQEDRKKQNFSRPRQDEVIDDRKQHETEEKIGTRNVETKTIVDRGDLSQYGPNYGSTSRPTIAVDRHQPVMRDDPDTYITSKSVLTNRWHSTHCTASGDDHHILHTSSEDGDVWPTENHPLVDFLAKDTKFRALCEHGLINVEKSRFAKNVRRLLGFFHKNLLTEARSEEEKTLARSLAQSQTRYRITQQLIQSIEDQHIMHDRTAQLLKEYLVDRYSGPIDLPEGELQSIHSIDDAPDASHDIWFRDSSELEKFLRDSQSFQTLIGDFMLWLLPIEVQDVLLSIPRSHIYLSQEQDLTLMNCIKSWVEDYTKEDWNWWPLIARKRCLSADETRLYWRCTCGKLQWIEILSKYNKLIEGFLEMGHEAPLAPYQCSPGRMKVPVIDYFKGVFRTTPTTSYAAATSATALRYIIPGSIAFGALSLFWMLSGIFAGERD